MNRRSKVGVAASALLATAFTVAMAAGNGAKSSNDNAAPTSQPVASFNNATSQPAEKPRVAIKDVSAFKEETILSTGKIAAKKGAVILYVRASKNETLENARRTLQELVDSGKFDKGIVMAGKSPEKWETHTILVEGVDIGTARDAQGNPVKTAFLKADNILNAVKIAQPHIDALNKAQKEYIEAVAEVAHRHDR